MPTTGPTDRPWWRGAAIYQVYVRSFADGTGDGIGDIAGIRARLPHLEELGIDAIWVNPWYLSPQADGGYDVQDYRAIDPLFGTLDDAEALITDAHAHGIRVIVDIVPNHCSDRHPWFQAALRAAPDSPERDRFLFRPGKGVDGELPPNNWQSNFHGPAWTRVTEPDGRPGEWYLHQFATEQPDFNWANQDVRAEFRSILRFWLDRGVDGFRIDVAHGLVKAAGLPDTKASDPVPYEDQDGVHDIWREWRSVVNEYPGERILVGEVWVGDPTRFARYLRPDELNSAFNFAFLQCGWDAASLRTVIDSTLATHALVGAPPTWVLSNHDVTRCVTRYGRLDTTFNGGAGHPWPPIPTDLALGTRRARAAALLSLALPGGIYIYQGDELGLWEVEDLPDNVLADPVWARSGHTDRGRDGCRVPIPWSGDAPPFGFGARSWLPQPPAWKALTVETERGDPHSMLRLYDLALQFRRGAPELGDGPMTWMPSEAGVLTFTRGAEFACVVNLGSAPATLPDHHEVLLASGPLHGGALPSETAAWLRVQPRT